MQRKQEIIKDNNQEVKAKRRITVSKTIEAISRSGKGVHTHFKYCLATSQDVYLPKKTSKK